MRIPLHLRKLKARMILAGIDLKTVAKRAKLNYSVASELLNGRRVDAKRLSKLSIIIEAEPIEEVAS